MWVARVLDPESVVLAVAALRAEAVRVRLRERYRAWRPRRWEWRQSQVLAYVVLVSERSHSEEGH